MLALALAGLVLAAGCVAPKTLSSDEVKNRSQEYFLRGMDQYQAGQLRPALESFRLAKAYDAAGSNPQIAEMIEKTETKLRIGSPPGAAQAPLTSDIMAICGSVSDWLHQSRAPQQVAGDGARAVQAARP